MREIKFRGKSVLGNNWEQGFYTFEGGYHIIRRCAGEFQQEGIPIIVTAISVCQYTGLKDAHGNEIFEGDILKFNTDAPGVVDYFRGSWRVKTPPRYSGDDWRTSLWDATVDGYEIIGNIYENSDLLKGD
jgi:uncharacterized phage protein (TIGR01671 family)